MSISFLCSLLHIASSGLCLHVTKLTTFPNSFTQIPVQMLYFIRKEQAHTHAKEKNCVTKRHKHIQIRNPILNIEMACFSSFNAQK